MSCFKSSVVSVISVVAVVAVVTFIAVVAVVAVVVVVAIVVVVAVVAYGSRFGFICKYGLVYYYLGPRYIMVLKKYIRLATKLSPDVILSKKATWSVVHSLL